MPIKDKEFLDMCHKTVISNLQSIIKTEKAVMLLLICLFMMNVSMYMTLSSKVNLNTSVFLIISIVIISMDLLRNRRELCTEINNYDNMIAYLNYLYENDLYDKE